MTMVETNIYASWAAKQTAKGSPAAAATRRFKQVGPGLQVQPDFGSEPYSDLDKFGDATDWVNQIVGQGTPAYEASAAELAWWLWIFHGQEAVTQTAAPDPVGLNNHHFEPNNNPGFWFTLWQRVGQAVINRQKFNDCRVSQLVLEASSANKAVRLTPTVMSLDPGEIFDTDPTPPMPASPVMIYTEAEGTFTINGQVIRGHTQFQLTLNEDLQLVPGDSSRPVDVARGNASAQLGCTINADADGRARYYSEVYGTPTPAAGAKPLSRVPLLGNYAFKMDKKDPAGVLLNRLALTIPGIRWQPVEFAPANPQGGTAELPLTGQLRKTPANDPLYKVDVVTAATEAAFTG
jgi:hypothetical protein